MKLLSAILSLVMVLPAMARPNWEDLTDGRHIYVVWKLEETYMALHTMQGEEHYVFMDRVSDSKFVIADGYPEGSPLPETYHVGDSVWRLQDQSLLFFDAKGRLYASMKPFRSWAEDRAADVRRQDSLRLIAGCYESTGNRQLMFRCDDEGNPVLSVDGREEERVSFMSDVMVGKTTLMHIHTPKRRWLLELTGEGMNVYSAVWNKTKRCYVRGGLLRRAKYIRSLNDSPYRFSYERAGLPLADILMRYCPKEMFVRLRDEVENQEKNHWIGDYYYLYDRIINTDTL